MEKTIWTYTESQSHNQEISGVLTGSFWIPLLLVYQRCSAASLFAFWGAADMLKSLTPSASRYLKWNTPDQKAENLVQSNLPSIFL